MKWSVLIAGVAIVRRFDLTEDPAMHFVVAIAALLVAQAGECTPPAAEAVDARREAHRRLVLALLADRKDGDRLGWKHFAPAFRNLYEENPEDYYGFDALEFLVFGGEMSAAPAEGDENPYYAEAIDQMTRLHAKGGRVEWLCEGLGRAEFYGAKAGPAERFLREVLEHNPKPAMRAKAALGLIASLEGRADTSKPCEASTPTPWRRGPGRSASSATRRSTTKPAPEAPRRASPRPGSSARTSTAGRCRWPTTGAGSSC